VSNIKKNIGLQTAYQVLNTCLPLITAPYLARVLGAEQLGIYSYTFSIVSYFTLFAMLGTVNYGTRSIAAQEEDEEKSKAFWEIYTLQLALSILTSVAYSLYVFTAVKNNKIIASIQGVYIISCALDINWLFFGIEKFKITVTRNFIIKILTVFSILFFVHDNADLWIYTLIMSISTLVSNAVLWFYVPRIVRRTHITFRNVMAHIKPNLVLFIPLLAMSIYHTMDKTMLGIMSNFSQSGYYYNADKIINIPVNIISGVGTVMLPRITNLLKNGDKKNANRLFLLSLEGVIVVSVAMGFGIASISKEFVPLFFGNGYDDCIILIVALSPVLIIKGISLSARNQFLIPYKYDSVFIISVIIGASANLMANALLIPKYGALGAVIGTLIAEFCACIYQIIFIDKHIRLSKVLVSSLIYVLFGMGMMLIVRLIGQTISIPIIFKLLLEVIIGASFFCICCFIYWKISNNQMYKEIFGNIIKKRT